MIPESGDGGLPAVQVEQTGDGHVLSLEFVRRRATTGSDLLYAVEFASSPDEASWVAPADPSETVTPIDLIWERVKVWDASSSLENNRRFGRLRVSEVE